MTRDAVTAYCYCYHLRQGGYVFIGLVTLFFLQYYAKPTQPIFTKFAGKVAHWSLKKPLLDFGSNPDHVTLGVISKITFTVRWSRAISRDTRYVLPCICVTVRILSGSAALAEVWALLSAILVITAVNVVVIVIITTWWQLVFAKYIIAKIQKKTEFPEWQVRHAAAGVDQAPEWRQSRWSLQQRRRRGSSRWQYVTRWRQRLIWWLRVRARDIFLTDDRQRAGHPCNCSCCCGCCGGGGTSSFIVRRQFIRITTNSNISSRCGVASSTVANPAGMQWRLHLHLQRQPGCSFLYHSSLSLSLSLPASASAANSPARLCITPPHTTLYRALCCDTSSIREASVYFSP